jgi:hypothetical protein
MVFRGICGYPAGCDDPSSRRGPGFNGLWLSWSEYRSLPGNHTGAEKIIRNILTKKLKKILLLQIRLLLSRFETLSDCPCLTSSISLDLSKGPTRGGSSNGAER